MYAPFKVQGSTPLGCKQFLGATPPDEKPTIYPDPCRETFEGAVHGSQGISQGARKLARTAKVIYIYIYMDLLMGIGVSARSGERIGGIVEVY
jgi:hypothetical protein